MGYIAEQVVARRSTPADRARMQRKLLEQLMGAEAMGVIQAVRPRPLALR